MEISARIKEDKMEIILNGNIDGYDEYVNIKSFIKNELIKATNFTFYFVKAVSIDSYILGYILKLKEIDKLNINIVVSNARLYEFLEHIDFNKFFDIKIKEYE